MSRKGGGFQHNNVYKITSMKDKNVIELDKSSTAPEAPLVVKKGTNKANQKFKVVQINPGEFQVSCLVQGSGDTQDQQVWDFLPSSPKLIQNTAGNGPNQKWVAEEIYPNSKICFIKSANDGRCIKNMGAGKQISLVPEDRRDAHQHWKLESTY